MSRTAAEKWKALAVQMADAIDSDDQRAASKAAVAVFVALDKEDGPDCEAVVLRPEVARLIAAVGPDNLPALLRYVLDVVPDYTDDEYRASNIAAELNVPADVWERLGEALDGDA